MIRLDSLTVKEFRGLRDLTLGCNGRNFAVCGPNGTGKSGVVDAIEFALTGSVSRLSGEGRGDISVRDHAPHVDSRNAPEHAQVMIEIFIPSLEKHVRVTRTVKSPKSAQVIPDDDDVRAVLATIQSQADFVLSRRELIKYVLATPGDRAEEIQALLRLEQIEKLRAGFLKIANASAKGAKEQDLATRQASDALLKALGVAELTHEVVLVAVNAKRALLGLQPLTTLAATSSLKDGLIAIPQGTPSRLGKVQGKADIAEATRMVQEIAGAEHLVALSKLQDAVKALAADPRAASALSRQEFLEQGALLLTDPACPFCDTAWDLQALRALIQKKREALADTAKTRTACEAQATPIAERLVRLQAAFAAVKDDGQRAPKPLAMTATSLFLDALATSLASIHAFMPLDGTLAALETAASVPQPVLDELASVVKAVEALPEPSQREAAQEWLVLAQERLEVWREARRKEVVAGGQAGRAKTIYEAFTGASDLVLTTMYQAVQDDFARLYAAINREDESSFTAQLIPSLGKLGFNVDFYGRGFFPPGAYHSEGHQDGMGLCLYLALMRYLHKNAFTFAVLDDVLMSVDSGHRREVCRVLKQEFPDTQFILTTHDPIWLKHMRSQGLVAGRDAVQFRKWDVATGPVEWDDRDVWAELDSFLDKNDVRAAAGLLRHYLEHESAELCGCLRARVEFRGDAQYELGELLPMAIARLKELYGKGSATANSHNQRDRVAAIGALTKQFSEAVTASNAEQWQINAAVHYNGWENLSKEEFAPVVQAFKTLLVAFRCPKCHSPVRVSPERATPEFLRCDCGDTSITLLPRPN